MSVEKPTILYPSKKIFQGEITPLSREEKEKTMLEIKSLDKTALGEKLKKYSALDFGKGVLKDQQLNYPEMMGLYQRALQLLGKDASLRVDGHFGKSSYEGIQALQKDVLKFTGTDVDGFPGPKTTEGILSVLVKLPETERVEVKQPNTEIPQIKPAPNVPPQKPGVKDNNIISLYQQLEELKRLQGRKVSQ